MADPRKPTRNAVHREKLCRLTRHRQERLERTADYFLKGNSFRSIAEQTGVSLAQVQRDVALCKREWSKSTSREIQSSVAKELARIDRIETEAWQAWERSQRERDERIEETTESAEHGTTIKKGKRTKKMQYFQAKTANLADWNIQSDKNSGRVIAVRLCRLPILAARIGGYPS